MDFFINIKKKLWEHLKLDRKKTKKGSELWEAKKLNVERVKNISLYIRVAADLLNKQARDYIYLFI